MRLVRVQLGLRGPRWPKKVVPKRNRGDPKALVGSWGKKLKCNLSRSWEASWDILEASWDYLGTFGMFWASCETAGGAQDDPGGPKKLQKGFQAAPKRCPRDAQEAPKSAQECSKKHPKLSQKSSKSFLGNYRRSAWKCLFFYHIFDF